MNYPTYRIEKSLERSEVAFAPELTNSELMELCECAQDIAQSAGEVILDIYHSSGNLGISTKDDQTPVTKADLASDERIISGLKKHTRFPIVTEEHPLDIADRKDRKSVWLVDPLDGTQNFINRDGQFCILISLLHFNRPVIGIIAAPQEECQWFAHFGGGAFYKKEGSKGTAIAHPLMERDLRVVLSSLPSKGGRQREETFCSDNEINDDQIFRVGSSLKLGRLAQGEFDATVRFDVLSEWDTAAADCVLTEANCRLSDVMTNEPIEYNSRASFQLPGYMVIRADYDFKKISE